MLHGFSHGAGPQRVLVVHRQDTLLHAIGLPKAALDEATSGNTRRNSIAFKANNPACKSGVARTSFADGADSMAREQLGLPLAARRRAAVPCGTRVC